MNNKIKKKIIIILFLIVITRLFVLGIYIIKTSLSAQNLYDILPENVIVIGEEVFEGYVNPNYIGSSAIEYYKKIKDKNINVYKYSGLDKNGVSIWGKYSDETNSYIEVTDQELKEVEETLKLKYKIDLED